MPKLLADERIFPPLDEPIPRGAIVVSKRIVQEDDGSTREQFIWVRGMFVVVVPVDGEGNFFLKKEFKYAQMQNLLTFPSGGIKVNEVPEDAAERELKEELGMDSDQFVLLSRESTYNSPDKSTESHFIFLAVNARRVDGFTPEQGEILKVGKAEVRNLLSLAIGGVKLRIALQRVALYDTLSFMGL